MWNASIAQRKNNTAIIYIFYTFAWGDRLSLNTKVSVHQETPSYQSDVPVIDHSFLARERCLRVSRSTSLTCKRMPYN